LKKSVIVGAFGVFGVCALLPSCGSDDSASCDETRTCAPGTDGGSDGNAPADAGGGDGPVVVPEGCDPAADPKDAPKCVVSDYGIFVDATGGSDNNTGTKELPMKSIGAALKKLNNRPRIYVCEGTYPESVKLTSPVSIYGGFKCGTWSAPADPAKIAPGAAGIEAIIVENVKSPIILSDLAPESAAGTASARNSIAMRIVGSTDVKLVRVKATAAAGFKGADGNGGSVGTLTAVSSGPMNLTGNSASGTTPGAAKVCTCSIGGTTTGGSGGGAQAGGASGGPSRGGVAPNDGAGGQGDKVCNPDGYGHNGADAPKASDASAPANSGELGQMGWQPTAGAPGGDGLTGQGGGGGGGKDASNAGGSGGCGGCGASGGKGGEGGGASIGVAIVDSTVTAVGCSIASSDGGAGGGGGAGGSGAAGGDPGGSLCSGGQGGKGGDGGAGAGGAGGISVGVLYKGTKPTIDSATDGAITVGSPGAKGTGGNSPTNDGPVGVAEKVLGI